MGNRLKLVVSILAHEKPEVVLDQLANLRHFLPDATVVLHLHRQFAWMEKKSLFGYPESAFVDFAKQPNVLVNPKSVTTLWANLHHAHHANFHYACRELDFDYFLLHSSSDMFAREGVEQYVSQHDCGVSILAPQPEFGYALRAEGDPVYQAIARDAGAKELWISQVEGTFYRRELFADLVARIERHHKFDPSKSYVHEEIYYPTIISAMNVKRGYPYLLREDRAELPSLDEKLVELIRAVGLPDHFKERWRLGRRAVYQVWEGKHIYAMRPVPRVYNHPLRQCLRDVIASAPKP